MELQTHPVRVVLRSAPAGLPEPGKLEASPWNRRCLVVTVGGPIHVNMRRKLYIEVSFQQISVSCYISPPAMNFVQQIRQVEKQLG